MGEVAVGGYEVVEVAGFLAGVVVADGSTDGVVSPVGLVGVAVVDVRVAEQSELGSPIPAFKTAGVVDNGV